MTEPGAHMRAVRSWDRETISGGNGFYLLSTEPLYALILAHLEIKKESKHHIHRQRMKPLCFPTKSNARAVSMHPSTHYTIEQPYTLTKIYQMEYQYINR